MTQHSDGVSVSSYVSLEQHICKFILENTGGLRLKNSKFLRTSQSAKSILRPSRYI